MATEAEKNRRKLVPLWIKIFGWLFILMGVAVPLMPFVTSIFDRPVNYEIFGLSHNGSPFHSMAITISLIILSLSASAYGLLFGKSWGVKACLITGYAGVVICLTSMAYSLIFLSSLSIRLELIIQFLYILKLRKIEPLWIEKG